MFPIDARVLYNWVVKNVKISQLPVPLITAINTHTHTHTKTPIQYGEVAEEAKREITWVCVCVSFQYSHSSSLGSSCVTLMERRSTRSCRELTRKEKVWASLNSSPNRSSAYLPAHAQIHRQTRCFRSYMFRNYLTWKWNSKHSVRHNHTPKCATRKCLLQHSPGYICQ